MRQPMACVSPAFESVRRFKGQFAVLRGDSQPQRSLLSIGGNGVAFDGPGAPGAVGGGALETDSHPLGELAHQFVADRHGQ